jgi:hypothetical protein
MSENDENILLEETEETENIQKKPIIKMSKKKLVVKVPTPKPVSDEEEEEEDTCKPVIKAQPKKERTEAQKSAFERCKKQREENAKKRADDAKKLMAFEKEALEQKLIAKAVSLKKKQIKKQVILDEISDDETPIEKVKEMAKKIKPVEKPKSLFNFI